MRHKENFTHQLRLATRTVRSRTSAKFPTCKSCRR